MPTSTSEKHADPAVTGTQPRPQQQRRLRAVALPVEHGGWGFLFEPLLLGLLVAPSLAGAGVAIFFVALFLLRHPLRLALGDWRKGQRYPRTRTAERVVLVYGTLATAGLLLVLALGQAASLLPFLLCSPLAAIYFVYDMLKQGRELLPEISGAIALSASAPVLALAAEWPVQAALLLWLIPIARNLGSILYVRARLQLERTGTTRRWPALLANLAIVLLFAGLAWAGHLPMLAAIAMLLLALRAFAGLSRWRRPARAQKIGFLEIGYGVLVVALAAAGYQIGW